MSNKTLVVYVSDKTGKVTNTIVPIPNNFRKCEGNNYEIDIATDSEYVSKENNPNLMLTHSFSDKLGNAITLENPGLGLGLLPTWKGKTAISKVLGLPETLARHIAYLTVNFLVFFAPSDVITLHTNPTDKDAFQKSLSQKGRLKIDTGSKYNSDVYDTNINIHTEEGVLRVRYRILDLSKVNGIGSLKSTAMSFGIPMEDKNLMDLYKINMLEPYTNPELFEDYVRYGESDSTILHSIYEACKERLKTIYGVHNLPVPDTTPLTIGTTVAGLALAWLEDLIGENKGYLHINKTDSKGIEKSWSLDDYLYSNNVGYYNDLRTNRDFRFVCLGAVAGGRANNARPTESHVRGVLPDVDVSGAYGTMMKRYPYCLGIPTKWSTPTNPKGIRYTLGEVLAILKGKLVPHCWKIIVTGEIEFPQTLITSKDINYESLAANWEARLDDGEEADPHIPSEFNLYTHEINNGVITHDVLELMKLQASDKELASFMRLEVTALMYYDRQLMCESIEQWNRLMSENNCKGISQNLLTGSIDDDNPKYWCPVDLNGFLQPYLDKRRELKSQMKSHPKGSEIYNQLDSQQNAFKLVVNTFYGVLAAPYFTIGNVCLADNITAGLRLVTWCMEAALHSYISVTDGGNYDINQVRYWKDKRPSFTTISNNREMKNTRRFYSKPMENDGVWTARPTNETDDLPTSTALEPYTTIKNDTVSMVGKDGGWIDLDLLTLEHMKMFFRKSDDNKECGLDILNSIRLEHKDVYVAATFTGQTNYQFEHINGSVKTKIRGHKTEGKRYNGETEISNAVRLMEDIRGDDTAVPIPQGQTISELLKVTKVHKLLATKQILSGSQADIFLTNKLYAGDSITKSVVVPLIPISCFIYQTSKQRKAMEKLAEEGQIVEHFINPDGTVNRRKALETIQDSLDAGMESPSNLKKYWDTHQD